MPNSEPITFLSMGWGKQTWTMAAMMALYEIPRADYIVFADTGHEHQATYQFREIWEPWLGEHGLTVVTVRATNTAVAREDWHNNVMIPAFTVASETGKRGQTRRQCTHDWKIVPIRRFVRRTLIERGLKRTPGAAQCWLGISYDEWQRMRSSDVAYVENVYPLVDRRITRSACIQWLYNHGLQEPPKSACTFCPFKSIGAWRELKIKGGLDWQEAVAVDKIVRNKRPEHELFIHPARVALSEAVTGPAEVGQLSFDGFENVCDGGHCGV